MCYICNWSVFFSLLNFLNFFFRSCISMPMNCIKQWASFAVSRCDPEKRWGSNMEGDTKLSGLVWANGEERIPRTFVQSEHEGSGTIKLCWFSSVQNHIQQMEWPETFCTELGPKSQTAKSGKDWEIHLEAQFKPVVKSQTGCWGIFGVE